MHHCHQNMSFRKKIQKLSEEGHNPFAAPFPHLIPSTPIPISRGWWRGAFMVEKLKQARPEGGGGSFPGPRDFWGPAIAQKY